MLSEYYHFSRWANNFSAQKNKKNRNVSGKQNSFVASNSLPYLLYRIENDAGNY